MAHKAFLYAMRTEQYLPTQVSEADVELVFLAGLLLVRAAIL